ncbi:TatD family hydrolase [soil metagenome]
MFTDTHCHLTHLAGGASAAVDKAMADGVSLLVTIGTDLASSAECVQIAAAHDGVHAAVGIHPNDAIEATDAVLRRIEELAAHPSVVAVGETGLDFFRTGAPPVRQEESFRTHIRIARDHDRTVVIHDREAHDDIVRVLRDEAPLPRVIFHCFSGGRDLVETCAAEGWYMSFAGNVTFKNAQPLQQAAAAAPLELLLTETDSPYLAPHPHRGKPNSPSLVAVTTAFIGQLRDVPTADMAALTSANARRALALPDPSDAPADDPV